MSEQRAIVVLMTAGTSSEAERIAKALVTSKLAACVSVIPRLESWFWWEGALQREEEVLLLAKTQVDRLEALVDRVREMHSYDTPEILAVSVAGGDSKYLHWLTEQMKSGS